jgi:hypothetical protein
MNKPPAPAEAQALEAALRDLLPEIDAVDAADGMAAAATLNRRLPFDGPVVGRIRTLCAQGVDAGWLLPRAAGPNVRFGRLAKDLGGYAVDCVWMKDGSGVGHTHTKGEINMCFAWEGTPRFDGHPPGWVVFAPGSHHVPTVTGGTMLFVYFTPDGAVVWDKA